MNRAIVHAQHTVGAFIRALLHPRHNQSSFVVKVELRDPKGSGYSEYIWLSDVAFSGKKLHGTISSGDEPQIVKTAKAGDRITIAPSRIADWMYIDNGHLRGGYTLRVLYQEAKPSRRADFRKTTGFTDADFRAAN